MTPRALALAGLESLSIDEGMQRWAQEELGVQIPEDILREFKGYWRTQPKLRTDWDATFKNRVRELVARKVLKPKQESVWQ
jgi:hypothetical protein